MTYVKQNILDASQTGDSEKEAILKNDANVDDLFEAVNEHDHSTGKGETVAHSSLSGVGTNSHADIDTKLTQLVEFYKTGIIPVSGATITYTYNGSGFITAVTFGGTLAGSASFTYDSSDRLTQEVWSVEGVTVTATHTYNSSNQLTDTSISIS